MNKGGKMKKYRLLKDWWDTTPTGIIVCNKGTELVYDNSFGKYYVKSKITWFHKYIVENNSEFFEEIKE